MYCIVELEFCTRTLYISCLFFLSPSYLRVSDDVLPCGKDGKCILLSCLIGNWIQMEEIVLVLAGWFKFDYRLFLRVVSLLSTL